MVSDLFHFRSRQAGKVPRLPLAPFAATTLEVLSGDRQTRDTASSLGESGYSRSSVQSRCRCSVVDQAALSQLLEGDIHRIERLALAGQDAEFNQFVERSGRFFGVASSTAYDSPLANSLWTAIWFWVRVPVLSTQSTVADPRASMAVGARVRTFLREIRHAPKCQKYRQHDGKLLGQE